MKEIPYIPNAETLARVKSGQLESAKRKNEKRIADIERMRNLARKEIGCITRRDLMMLGIGLYLGEGTKQNEYIRIVNSDPDIIKLSMRWFREICKLSDKNFKAFVHLYPDVPIEKAINYWSKILKIPIDQFGKTQIDNRTNKASKKKNKLPYGTLHLQIKSCGSKELGRSLHRKIMGWIETVISQN